MTKARTFYSLAELVADGNRKEEDLLQLALNGELALSRWFDGETPVLWAITQVEYDESKGTPSKYIGWATIPAEAVDLLFKGKAKIGHFTTEDGREFDTAITQKLSCAPNFPGINIQRAIDVQRSDLFVLAKERNRFELSSFGGIETQSTSDINQREEPISPRTDSENRLTIAIKRAMHDLRQEFKAGKRKRPTGNDIFNRLREDDPTSTVAEWGKDAEGEPTLTWETLTGKLRTVKKKTIMTKISAIRTKSNR